MNRATLHSVTNAKHLDARSIKHLPGFAIRSGAASIDKANHGLKREKRLPRAARALFAHVERPPG
jgi:hypothetical protein